jgi:hypothetical protein
MRRSITIRYLWLYADLIGNDPPACSGKIFDKYYKTGLTINRRYGIGFASKAQNKTRLPDKNKVYV